MENLRFEDFHPGVSIDCVIFGFHQNELRVLLMKLKNTDLRALPGGFVRKGQDVDDEAIRVLKERTGLSKIFLKQFHFFGRVDRIPEDHADFIKKIVQKDYKDWFNQRFITLGYYSLVEFSKVKTPKPDFTSESCDWYNLRDLPDLMLDHHEVLTKAHESLKRELNYHPIGIDLLPERFTLPELQALYEAILERPLDRRNFRRKILSYGLLVPTNERRVGGRHKAPLLYEFDKEQYKKAVLGTLKSGW